jgi:hypothetical protein
MVLENIGAPGGLSAYGGAGGDQGRPTLIK